MVLKLTRREAVLLAATSVAMVGPARADNYPSRPVKIIVPPESSTEPVPVKLPPKLPKPALMISFFSPSVTMPEPVNALTVVLIGVIAEMSKFALSAISLESAIVATPISASVPPLIAVAPV